MMKTWLILVLLFSTIAQAQTFLFVPEGDLEFITETDIRDTAILMPTLLVVAKKQVEGEKIQAFLKRVLKDLETSKFAVSTKAEDCGVSAEKLKKSKAKARSPADGKGLPMTCFNMDYYKKAGTLSSQAEVAGTLIYMIAKYYKYTDKDASEFATAIYIAVLKQTPGVSA